MIEIDCRQMTQDEREQTVVFFNGVEVSVISASEYSGIIEIFKTLQVEEEGERKIRPIVYDRPLEVGESYYNGYITEYRRGFVQIKKKRLDPEPKNT